MKKTLIFALTFLCSLFFPCPIMASQEVPTIEKELLQQKETTASVTDYDSLIELLSDSIMQNKAISITLPETFTNYPLAKIQKDVFRHKTKKTYDLDRIVEVESLIKTTYVYEATNTIAYEELQTKGCTYTNDLTFDYEDYYESILEELHLAGMTDYEKVYTIHDFICKSYTYDNAFASGKNTNIPTLASASEDRAFVCQNYAVLTKDLLTRADVPCIIVLGFADDVCHAFNLVQIGEKWYWLDTTWNDSTNSTDYFLTGSNTFLLTHTVAPLYQKSLKTYKISKTDCKQTFHQPQVISVTVSKQHRLHVDYALNDATKCKLSLDGTIVKNHHTVTLKNGSELTLSFNDGTCYHYICVKKQQLFYILFVCKTF